ncbi:MAG TPA: ATP-binding protein [Verrucomicrobiae bacterium]|nr:ATP-binding protein [Verrucomicrobiae bacterium]
MRFGSRFLVLLFILFTLLLFAGGEAGASRGRLFLFSVFFLLAGGIGFWFLRPKSRSAETLAAAAEKMKCGDFSARVSLPAEDGLAPLGQKVNELAEGLQKEFDEMKERELVQNATMETLSEGVLAADAEGKILFANPTIRSIFALSAEPVGQPFHLVFRQPTLLAAFEKVLREGGNEKVQIKEAFPTHKVVDVYLLAPPRTRRARVVVVFQDSTQAYRLEQVRKDFVANASHELRTPLAVIRGYLETLEDGLVAEAEKKQVFHTLNDNVRRMGNLIDDLLHLSKLESPEFTLKPEKLAVLEVVQAALTALIPQAEAKKQQLSLKISSGLHVTGDRQELEVALKNILENAIHYTGEGGEITATAAKKEGAVEISVTDTGIGIPSQDLGRIFERFYRVEKSRSKEEGGTGLGLSIVKHIAEAHGGRVEVESEVGKGSRFTLVIPG